MNSNSPKRTLAFVVPTLSEVAAQNEEIVELLLFAAAHLAQAISRNPHQPISATIITVEPDTSGWSTVSTLLPKEVLKHVTVEVLKEPATPNLAVAGHKPA